MLFALCALREDMILRVSTKMTGSRQTDPPARTSRLYNWGSAILAFVAWGGWAFYVNRSSGLATGVTSGVAQGTISMLMTFVMIQSVTGIFRRLTNRYLQLTLPTLVTVGSAAGLLVLVHSLVGTPNIFWTILPGLSGAVPFCFYTSYKLLPREQ
jgi:hypothetical protein